jgi:hypothetical protein
MSPAIRCARNARLVAVTARPAAVVPLLAASWDWDLRSLARGVEEDTTWGVVRLSPIGASQVSRLGGGPAPFENYLEDAEAVVARYDASTITPERGAALLRYLERGGGVLLWIDPRPRPPAESPLTRALGLVWRFRGAHGRGQRRRNRAGGRTTKRLLGGTRPHWPHLKDLPPVEPLVALEAPGGTSSRSCWVASRGTPLLAKRSVGPCRPQRRGHLPTS